MNVYFYLACFDVQDDKLRRLVVKALLEYGYRIQGSVFELAISESELQQLTQKLTKYCDDFDDALCTRKFFTQLYDVAK